MWRRTSAVTRFSTLDPSFFRVLVRSIRLDVSGPDHFGPLLGFIHDQLAEIGGRAGQRSASHVDKSRFDPWVREPGVDLPVELVDDLDRRISGRAEAEP